MGSLEAEAEAEAKVVMLLSKMKSGMSPPLQCCSAAVPFQWEEEPGKPRTPSTTIAQLHLDLELPPRLVPSPTINKRPKASSFRMPTPRTRPRDINSNSNSNSDTHTDHHMNGGLGYGSIFSFSPHSETERGRGKLQLQVGPSRRWLWQSKDKVSSKWFFKGWKKSSEMKGRVAANDDKQEQEQEQEQQYWTNNSSFALLSSSQTKSQFWATIYGGLKQVMPWKARPRN